MQKNTKLLLLMAAGLLIINVGAIAFYLLYLSAPDASVPNSDAITTDAPQAEASTTTDSPIFNEEYYSIHFNHSDAVEVCKLEAKSRNKNLIQLSVNDLSSRFNPISKMYLIKLDSLVGTPLLYDEKSHTCHIDPQTQGVAFYQEITRRTAVRPNG